MRRPPLLPLLPLVPLLACELTEVTVPQGEPRIVVHAVLDRRSTFHVVIVERSLTGGPRGDAGFEVPPEEPRIAITGATVTLRHLGPGPCDPAEWPLVPRADTSGIYEGPGLCPLSPGDRIALRVETPDGGLVTGETTIPGARDVAVRSGPDSALAPGDELSLNRDRDTLRIAADPILARALQVEASPGPALDNFAVYLFTDTLGVALPGNLVNPFEGDSGETVFRAGRAYKLSVAVTDTNYYDFVRSRTDPFTGRGFINHLQGGIGVFGSVDAYRYTLRVTADVDDPREGLYRLQGQLDGRDVDLEMELYLDPLAHGEFSAFLVGTWYYGSLIRFFNESADGSFQTEPGGGETLVAQFVTPAAPGLPEDWWLSARRPAPGQSFPVNVTGRTADGTVVVAGTVTATQVSGPVASR